MAGRGTGKNRVDIPAHSFPGEDLGNMRREQEGAGVEATAWGLVPLKLTRKILLCSDMRSQSTWSRGRKRCNHSKAYRGCWGWDRGQSTKTNVKCKTRTIHGLGVENGHLKTVSCGLNRMQKILKKSIDTRRARSGRGIKTSRESSGDRTGAGGRNHRETDVGSR